MSNDHNKDPQPPKNRPVPGTGGARSMGGGLLFAIPLLIFLFILGD